MSRFKLLSIVGWFIVSFFITNLSYASHMIGGDVYYRCLGNNVFRITIILYQDCLTGDPFAIEQDNPANYAIFTGANLPFRTGQANYTSKETVSPNFNNACINNYPNTCLQKMTFEFDVTLPPSATGYKIIYARCCRNAFINNLISPGETGVTYYATIPPFGDKECPNNSAIFKNFPPQIICANNPFVYDFSAIDPDADSLTYQLCAAKNGASTNDPKPTGQQMVANPPNVSYNPPYTAQVPINGAPAFHINPTTGIMTGTPTGTGRYIVTVCVSEWRNGQVINTFSRDVQFVITNCSKAVVANIPELPDEPNTYTVQCKDYTVKFSNTSTGGFSYEWDFGVPGATSTEFEPTFTYPDTGTYYVTLVVNKGSTCPDSITRIVKVYPHFKADYEFDGQMCPESDIRFTDKSTTTYGTISKWHWNFDDGTVSDIQNPIHAFRKPGGSKQVTLIAKSSLGCRDTFTQTIPISYFDPFAGNDTTIVLGYPFTMNATGAAFYEWTPSQYLDNATLPQTGTSFPDTGTYTYVLRASNEEGCIAHDTINILVVKYSQLFIPNAFSPNGDGLNDVFEPKIVGYSLINAFSVYNRFGQKVYATSNVNRPAWDGRLNGKVCEIGTYFWIINATDAFGNKKTLKGDVTLLR
jgi:gliding motility-associated-like protein